MQARAHKLDSTLAQLGIDRPEALVTTCESSLILQTEVAFTVCLISALCWRMNKSATFYSYPTESLDSHFPNPKQRDEVYRMTSEQASEDEAWSLVVFSLALW